MTFQEELEIILKEELKVLKLLTKLAYEKTDIIMEEEVGKLSEIINEEEKLVNKMGNLEETRLKHLDDWGVAMDTPISDVIENIIGDKEKLIGLRDDLSNVLEDLDGKNKSNNRLIEQNLEWIDFNLNLLNSTQTPASYGKDPEDKASGDSNIFDRKV